MNQLILDGARGFAEYWHINMDAYEYTHADTDPEGEYGEWDCALWYTSKFNGARLTIDAAFEVGTGKVIQGYFEFHLPEYTHDKVRTPPAAPSNEE